MSSWGMGKDVLQMVGSEKHRICFRKALLPRRQNAFNEHEHLLVAIFSSTIRVTDQTMILFDMCMDV